MTKQMADCGTTTKYKHGCRCDDCCEAVRLDAQRRRQDPEERKRWDERSRKSAEKYRDSRNAQGRRHNKEVLYGLPFDEYERLRLSQDGHCAACSVVATRLVLDHDHETGRNRAFLCDNCNFALGHVHDDPAVLLALVDYLEAFAPEADDES